MGGGYLSSANVPGGYGGEYNFAAAPASSCYVMQNWPTDIVSIGYEVGPGVVSGPPSGAATSTNPIKDAYSLSNVTTAPSWDQLAVLYGVDGLSTNFQDVGIKGTNTVNCSTGANSWTTATGNVTYLGKIASDISLESTLNNLQAEAPDINPPLIAISVPSASSTVSGSSVTLTASSTDAVYLASIQFELDGTDIGSVGTSSPYTIIWNSTGVSNGTHTLSAVATNGIGNSATSSISVTVSNPPVITSIATSSIGTSTATITWTT